MKKLILGLFLLIGINSEAQFIIDETANRFNGNNYNIEDILRDYTILDYKSLKNYPNHLEIKINSFNLILDESDINPDIIVSNNSKFHSNPIYHYKGTIEGIKSFVAISFTNNDAMGLIITPNSTHTLGKIKNSDKFILYNNNDLLIEDKFQCHTLDSIVNINNINSIQSNKCVNWYWETNYEIFQDKGSTQNVNFFIQGLFNQVQMLDANDGININLQTLYIWNTSDPYLGPASNNFLNQFDSIRTSFNGDCAHLLGLGQQGGISWVGGLCANVIYRHSFSDIYDTYSNIPVYSWAVENIIHEEGHEYGSPHTHACAWNGNNTVIDGCNTCWSLPTEGGCSNGTIPSNGGTIMSYCHGCTVGINFSLGFGIQPKTLITTNISNSSCLADCNCLPITPITINGSNNVLINQNNLIYTTPSIAGVISYNWLLPPGMFGYSTTNSISVSTLVNFSGGFIYVNGINSCGSGNSIGLQINKVE